MACIRCLLITNVSLWRAGCEPRPVPVRCVCIWRGTRRTVNLIMYQQKKTIIFQNMLFVTYQDLHEMCICMECTTVKNNSNNYSSLYENPVGASNYIVVRKHEQVEWTGYQYEIQCDLCKCCSHHCFSLDFSLVSDVNSHRNSSLINFKNITA